MITAKVVTLNAGYASEKDRVRGLSWKVGDEFEVEDISVGGFHTGVKLKGLGYFNSVFFEIYEDGKHLDIFRDRRFNKYMNMFQVLGTQKEN